MIEMGAVLQELRLRHKLTLKEVQEKSFTFAAEQNNAAYRISASWLQRLERGRHALSLSKLILLAHIYRVTPDELLQNTHPAEQPTSPLRELPMPNATMLLQQGPLDEQARYLLRNVPAGLDVPDRTRLLSDEERMPTEAHYLQGIIGQDDCILNPLVPPGSVVVVDTRQRTFPSGKEWQSEFQRPIYFLLTHESYVCGWCEFDKATDWLTIVSHPLSGAPSQHWKYRREIENLGRVVMVTVPWGHSAV